LEMRALVIGVWWVGAVVETAAVGFGLAFEGASAWGDVGLRGVFAANTNGFLIDCAVLCAGGLEGDLLA
jgi:hypothetical protein